MVEHEGLHGHFLGWSFFKAAQRGGTQLLNRVAAFSFLHHHKSEGLFWFRIFRYGLAFYTKPKFSDRLFKRKRILGYYIEWLR